jgi:hypothetical protein
MTAEILAPEIVDKSVARNVGSRVQGQTRQQPPFEYAR